MKFLYLDSSAWVKRYYPERGSDAVQRLFDGDYPRCCSALGIVEVVATFARKRNAGELTKEEFETIIADLERDWMVFVQLDVSPSVIEEAKQIAARMALRGADAVHLAAVQTLRRDLERAGHEIILVTSDRELRVAAELSGIAVTDPGKLSD